MGISMEANVGKTCEHNLITKCQSHNNTNSGFGGWANTDHNTLSNNFAYWNGEHGMYYANDDPAEMPDFNIVSNCHFNWNTLCGIHYWAGCSNIFESNVIIGTGTVGILVESYGGVGDRGVCHNNTFSNNLVVGSGGQGIYCYGYVNEYGKQNKAVGNTVLNSLGDGIQFEYQNYFVVSNNDIDMTGCGSNQNGIRLLTRCMNGTVTGNTILNSDGEGILLTSNSHHSLVASNTITKAGTFGLSVGGSDNVTVTGNKIGGSGNYDLYIWGGTDGSYLAVNHVSSIHLNHTAETNDYNRFFGNLVLDLSQTGSGTGNTFVDNYPDNSP